MPLFGARTTTNFASYNARTGLWEPGEGNIRPTNYRDLILYDSPNGDTPLFALTSQMKKEPTDDPVYHWFRKDLPEQAGEITGIFVDPALATPYTGGGVIGTPLYLQVDSDTVAHFREGHQALIMDTNDPYVSCNSLVQARYDAGPNSVIHVILTEADDNSSTGDLTTANRVLIIGNANSELAPIPSAVSYDPTEYSNITQIFRTSLEFSRTALKTRIRTGDAYSNEKLERLKHHAIEIEKAFFWGQMYRGIGANGHELRLTQGMIPFIRDFGGIVSDFVLNPLAPIPAATPWASIDGGVAWLNYLSSLIFKTGGRSRIGFCGTGVILAINRLVTALPIVNFELKTTTEDFGIQVKNWVTPFGTVHFMIHPLFAYEPSMSNAAVIFDWDGLRYRYIDDTDFYPDGAKINTGHGRVDGIQEEWLTECGLEFNYPHRCGFLTGFGQDRP